MIGNEISQNVLSLARGIKLLLMDCDGVLTDGRLYFSAAGEELKVFDVKDGQGLVSWRKAGFSSGIISGRKSEIVEMRARELGIGFVHQGVEDKLIAFLAILAEAAVSDPMQVAYIGDDIGDIPLMKKVGLAVAVAVSEFASDGGTAVSAFLILGASSNVTVPPAFSIFSRAVALTLSACTFRPCFSSPSPRIFIPAK